MEEEATIGARAKQNRTLCHSRPQMKCMRQEHCCGRGCCATIRCNVHTLDFLSLGWHLLPPVNACHFLRCKVRSPCSNWFCVFLTYTRDQRYFFWRSGAENRRPWYSCDRALRKIWISRRVFRQKHITGVRVFAECRLRGCARCQSCRPPSPVTSLKPRSVCRDRRQGRACQSWPRHRWHMMNIAARHPRPPSNPLILPVVSNFGGGFIATCAAALRPGPNSVVLREYLNHGFCACNAHLFPPSFTLRD
jgi:hypothetical protein